jgi:hypothetical protein
MVPHPEPLGMGDGDGTENTLKLLLCMLVRIIDVTCVMYIIYYLKEAGQSFTGPHLLSHHLLLAIQIGCPPLPHSLLSLLRYCCTPPTTTPRLH